MQIEYREMMLRKRNLNIQSNAELAKEATLAVKRKNSNAKNAIYVEPNVDVKPVAMKVLPEVRMMTEDPVPDYDFDLETASDPYSMSPYARDIFIYYQYREQFFKVRNYLTRTNWFSAENRIRLVDWMVEVQETFELNHETLYLSVKLLDMYLSKARIIHLEDTQVIASAAIFIASKFDERSPPLIDDFVYLSGDTISRAQIIVMEREVLHGIGFDLGAPISYRFLRRYARVTNLDMPTLTLARYILEMSLVFLDFCRVSESLIALASYMLAVRMKKIGDWTPILQKYSGYKLEEVEPLIASLNHMLCVGRMMAETIYNKYSHEIFFNVAYMHPLPDVIPDNEPIGPPANLLSR